MLLNTEEGRLLGVDRLVARLHPKPAGMAQRISFKIQRRIRILHIQKTLPLTTQKMHPTEKKNGSLRKSLRLQPQASQLRPPPRRTNGTLDGSLDFCPKVRYFQKSFKFLLIEETKV
ncbi:hypothetical protein AKJ64_04310 [candidate division MSBL1 archaeon SCGC-AAA259E17]|uniref:Uncharacterized protein n=1 Tax=candidate division MSBL1 archaeon SCGC-AAA259E17 TaxID=1698263 RepID=A0A133UCQ1_9EURY|nr:hypothetical protein AKJ64_04310 [candidate division MSBL1 archaeon SCGC-AAA259E17]